VLDFQPNAVHSGLYAAAERGLIADQGLDLEIAEPTGTADGAKLLEAGRADFAILDINDFGIARRRGFDVVAVAAIVQRPLAAVIAADRERFREPADLAGATVGVTGVPSDDAVLQTVLANGGLSPADVETQTIGFQAAALLASGSVDAATAFWNAEGVQLRQQGLLTREFRVDQLGAPRYPELVLAAAGSEVDAGEPQQDSILCRLLIGIERGYEVLDEDPSAAVDDLAAQVPEVDADSQRAQLAELVAADAFAPEVQGSRPTVAIDSRAVRAWVRWAEANGVLPRSEAGPGDVLEGFRDDLLPSCAGLQQAAGA
jgi:NitT/TauT family transport system substrate-binding protein/putative hydroxymethylpyrimidine transport system substrate-binding protein